MNRRSLMVVGVFCAVALGSIPASGGGFVSFSEFFEDVTYYDDVRAIVTTSDGSFVLSGAWTGRVATHSRDTATGALTWVDEYNDGLGGIQGLELTTAIAISPDSKHVYACGGNADGLVGFERDVSTGELTLIEYFIDGQDGVDGLDNPRGILVSPDGAHVYVAGATDDSIAIFSRNATTGALTYVGMVTDGVDGVSGLSSVFRMVSTGNGSHVYSGGTSIAVFSRDAGTGLLTYVEDHTLAFSRGLALDKTNRHLFVSSRIGDTLSVYDRDLGTGQLTLSSTVTDGVEGVDGLDGPWPVTLDPRNANAYVGCEFDTMAVFHVGIFRDGFESGDESEW